LPSPRSFADEAALSLRNLENIVSVLELPLKSHTALCYCYVSNTNYLPLAQAAWETYYNGNVPPTLYISVPSLPREAMVEWQVILHAPLPTPFGEEEYDNTTDEELDAETVAKLAAMKVTNDPFGKSSTWVDLVLYVYFYIDIITCGSNVNSRAQVKDNITTIVVQTAGKSNHLHTWVRNLKYNRWYRFR
jgi:hypothetical protein